MFWSIHKSDKSMDRAGKATDYNFSVFTHADLVPLVEFSLCRDNYCWAVGRVWQRLFAIPVGGSFNAQSTDLYCIWSFHLQKTRSRQWGTLSSSSQGYPMSHLQHNQVVLCCETHPYTLTHLRTTVAQRRAHIQSLWLPDSRGMGEAIALGLCLLPTEGATSLLLNCGRRVRFPTRLCTWS